MCGVTFQVCVCVCVYTCVFYQKCVPLYALQWFLFSTHCIKNIFSGRNYLTLSILHEKSSEVTFHLLYI